MFVPSTYMYDTVSFFGSSQGDFKHRIIEIVPETDLDQTAAQLNKFPAADLKVCWVRSPVVTMGFNTRMV